MQDEEPSGTTPSGHVHEKKFNKLMKGELKISFDADGNVSKPDNIEVHRGSNFNLVRVVEFIIKASGNSLSFREQVRLVQEKFPDLKYSTNAWMDVHHVTPNRPWFIHGQKTIAHTGVLWSVDDNKKGLPLLSRDGQVPPIIWRMILEAEKLNIIGNSSKNSYYFFEVDEDGLEVPHGSPDHNYRIDCRLKEKPVLQKWAVHEDENLCRMLQNEEFTQHYSGNRTRNGLLREDIGKAREEQLREEQKALEERFNQLQRLQQQAEDDELLAKQLAERYQMGIEEGSLLENPGQNSAVKYGAKVATTPPITSLRHSPLPSDINVMEIESRKALSCASGQSSPGASSQKETSPRSISNGNGGERKVKSIMKTGTSHAPVENSRKEMFTPLLGAAAPSTSEACSSRLSPPMAIALALNPELSDKDLPSRLQEEEAKLLQEKLDEVIAFKLQKQLEEMEIETAKRIEAQDRELARIIHQKEQLKQKERLRRAKERAKMKAAAMLSSSSPENALSPNPELSVPGSSSSAHSSPHSPDHGSSTLNDSAATNSSSGSSGRGTHSSSRSSVRKSPSTSWTFDSPPNLPEKLRLDRDDPVRFRAASKALPPSPLSPSKPSSSESRRLMSKSSGRSHYDDFLPAEESPPYMPLQGLQNLQKKRNK